MGVGHTQGYCPFKVRNALLLVGGGAREKPAIIETSLSVVGLKIQQPLVGFHAPLRGAREIEIVPHGVGKSVAKQKLGVIGMLAQRRSQSGDRLLQFGFDLFPFRSGSEFWRVIPGVFSNSRQGGVERIELG